MAEMSQEPPDRSSSPPPPSIVSGPPLLRGFLVYYDCDHTRNGYSILSSYSSDHSCTLIFIMIQLLIKDLSE